MKSRTELAHVAKAAALSDAAMTAAIAAMRRGGTEREVATAAHNAMYSRGGSPPGFPPLIRPLWMLEREHVSWSDRRIAEGDGLFIELSGCHARYHAPLSRTVFAGSAPPDAATNKARAETAWEAARAAIRPGAVTGDVYAAWRKAAGPDGFRHHCGYLVGIGFPPSWVGGARVLGVAENGTTRIMERMVFHLMSWTSRHVVSDTVTVLADGAERLTDASRELVAVS
ncbi:M24 family metallopeptidase [Saccharomonospora sp. NPDC006951]